MKGVICGMIGMTLGMTIFVFGMVTGGMLEDYFVSRRQNGTETTT